MSNKFTEVSAGGRSIKIPSVHTDDQTVIVTGKWVRIASVRGEEWSKGQVVTNPDTIIAKLKESGLKVDFFVFSQKLPCTKPKHRYHMEWDNVAAIPITSYREWWEKRLPQVTRKSVRRGIKRGVVARVAEFDDELIKGIMGIHDVTLMKQGAPFAHYGKNFSTVKQEYGTYLDRSEFLGAYYESELIGIIKLVYMENIASILQIISKEAHYDKRPTNILIAKAVEVCEEKTLSFLVYGKFVYGNKTSSPLTEFKRRNGFEQINIPKYYIPLSLKGKLILKLKLHRGLIGILPGNVISFLLTLRAWYYRTKLRWWRSAGKVHDMSQTENTTDARDKDD